MSAFVRFAVFRRFHVSLPSVGRLFSAGGVGKGAKAESKRICRYLRVFAAQIADTWEAGIDARRGSRVYN